MVNKKIVYIGELPPPFGGVTIKNKIVFDEIFKELGTEFIDVQECRRFPWKTPVFLWKIIHGMLSSDAVIVGTGAKWRDKILLILQRILTGKQGLKKVSKIVMGGRYHELIKNDSYLIGLISQIKSVWVESEVMIQAFKKMGIEHTYFFPNCRVDEGAKEPQPCQNGKLKLVFFSRICREKGVDDIIAAYESLDESIEEITLDFYGELETDIKEDFLKFVEKYENVCYHGVYDAVNGNVYAELNQYDIMLLPTHWKGEGVPGALIESKMAGITAIVSDWHMNSEVIKDGEEGIVLISPISVNLADTIKKLLTDRNMVCRLKKGAYESRKRYCIETYRKVLIDHTFR